MDENQTEAKSLTDQLDELDVVEAEELQEGAAFHAFRFSMAVE